MIIQEIRDLLNNNPHSKIALVIRHGEKNYAPNGLLSENGIVSTKKFATDLKNLGYQVNIVSSPELRCIQTANIINEILSNNENEIILSNKLGCPGLQVLNINIYKALYKIKKAREIFYEWKEGFHLDCLRTPKELNKLSMEFFRKSCKDSNITLFISQSGTVSGIGYSLGLLDYDKAHDEWIGFLEGFFLEIANRK
ncbi:MAG: phosphoglycerate mutase family protein [Treponema sp.]|nr:phosphoglycerate mutase family protein [Treponema sp.]